MSEILFKPKKMTAKEALAQITDRVPLVEGVTKIELGFPSLFKDEINAVMLEVAKAAETSLGKTQNITGAGELADPCIRIPLSVINAVDESGAVAIMIALKKTLDKSREVTAYKENLNALAGSGLYFMRATDNTDGFKFYECGVGIGSIFDPNRKLDQLLNKTLGKDLFTSVLMEGEPPQIKLMIKEKNVNALLTNPKLIDIQRIFSNLQSRHSQSEPGISKILRRASHLPVQVKETITHYISSKRTSANRL